MAKSKKRKKSQRGAPRRRQGADRWSWYVLFGGAAVLLVFLGLLVLNAVRDQASGDSTPEAFDLPELFGDERVRLADLGGKPTVVNFFASWCVECERELPEYTAAAEALGDEIDFVFVQSQETSAGAGRGMAREHGLESFTVARDVGSRNDELSRALGARGMPLTAFYDEQGNLVDVARGALVGGALLRALETLGWVA